jgi:hypothetical protein
MSKRSQEKRQARAKERKLARRRRLGGSPLSRLAGAAEETCECWMSISEDEAMLSLHVMRPARGGQTVGAFFLVDRDCVGLKDAFYRLDIDPIELRESLRERSRSEGMRIVQVELAEVRRLVAGAIRWTRAHPFRVPPDAERCVKILGGVGDIETADVSDFGDENGDMYYVGRQVDLVKCLQGLTLEEFLERDDVTYSFHLGDETFGYGDDFAEEEEDEEDDEGRPLMDADELDEAEFEEAEADWCAMRDTMKRNMLDGSRRWCISQAMMPHPELETAVDLTVAAAFEGLREEDEDAGTMRALDARDTLTSLETPEKQAALSKAMAQLRAFAASFPTPADYMRAMGAHSPGVR